MERRLQHGPGERIKEQLSIEWRNPENTMLLVAHSSVTVFWSFLRASQTAQTKKDSISLCMRQKHPYIFKSWKIQPPALLFTSL